MKTTSLELSRQLKEAGAGQGGEVAVHESFGGPMRFTTDGLLARLPVVIGSKGVLHLMKLNDVNSEHDTYAIGYMDYRGVISPVEMITDNNAAEALGKLLLWCLNLGYVGKAGENGHG